MPLTIWTNQAFPADLAAQFRARLEPHRVVWSADSSPSVLSAAGRDQTLVDSAHIAFGQPSPDDVLAARHLKLVCLSSAGYTRYDTGAFRAGCREKGIVVCNASGVYAEPCAQHLLAFMLSGARRMAEAAEVHATVRMKAAASSFRKPRSKFSDADPTEASTQGATKAAFDHWPTPLLRAQSTLLSPGQTVLLVGYGAIARRIAELLTPFGLTLRAFRRSPRGDEVCPTLPITELDDHLPQADHVVNILPLSEATKDFFNSSRLARMKHGSRYYNMGRGDTNDQAALIRGLVSGQIAQAFFDVTSPEPLPMNDPLWLAPNCYITPHTAGGTGDERERQMDHFVDNVRRFERDDTVRDRIV
jgi:phosphoglycerate dehydrogenase-like enzyme